MAMGAPRGDDEESGAFVDINITPLTDVVLVLLIIFMVSSTAAVEQVREKTKAEAEAALSERVTAAEKARDEAKAQLDAMKVERTEGQAHAEELEKKVLLLEASNAALTVSLPTGGAADVTMPGPGRIHLRVPPKGPVVIDGDAVGDGDVVTRLRGLAIAVPGVELIVEADKASQHGRVVQVLDWARVAGVERVAIGTRKDAGK